MKRYGEQWRKIQELARYYTPQMMQILTLMSENLKPDVVNWNSSVTFFVEAVWPMVATFARC